MRERAVHSATSSRSERSAQASPPQSKCSLPTGSTCSVYVEIPACHTQRFGHQGDGQTSFEAGVNVRWAVLDSNQ